MRLWQSSLVLLVACAANDPPPKSAPAQPAASPGSTATSPPIASAPGAPSASSSSGVAPLTSSSPSTAVVGLDPCGAMKTPSTPEEKRQAELAAEAERIQSSMIVSINGKLTTVNVNPTAQGCVIGDAGVRAGPGPKGEVELGKIVTTKAVPKIDRTILLLRSHLRSCYGKALDQDPKLAGKLTLTIRMGPNGEEIAKGTSEVTGLSPPLITCITKRRIDFEPPGGEGSTVLVPVQFSPTK